MIVRRVVGDSMRPALVPGQVIVGIDRSPAIGDVVIARQNGREVVKRVARIEDGSYFLEGDNQAASTDSRTYGPVERKAILGVMTMKFPIAVKGLPFAKPYGHVLSLLAAGIMIVLTLVLLFRIDTFLPLLDTALPGGVGTAYTLGSLLLITQVAAVPYLLRMSLSPLAHIISGKCAVLAPLAWVWICIWTLGTGVGLPIFGEFITVESTWAAFAVLLLWLALSVYVLYASQYDKAFARLSKLR